MKALVVLLAVSFIAALVVSWIYELAPAGLRRDEEVVSGATAYAGTERRLRRRIGHPAEELDTLFSPTPGLAPGIVVMKFAREPDTRDRTRLVDAHDAVTDAVAALDAILARIPEGQEAVPDHAFSTATGRVVHAARSDPVAPAP